MKIEIERPHPEYPFAYVHVPVTVDTDRPDLGDILAKNRLSLLGRWEPHIKNGVIRSVKAPVLLEDEHTPMPKKRGRPARK
jgi:hypothetical protein